MSKLGMDCAKPAGKLGIKGRFIYRAVSRFFVHSFPGELRRPYPQPSPAIDSLNKALILLGLAAHSGVDN